MRTPFPARRCGAALLLALAAGSAQAAIVTYQFGGVVTHSVVGGVASGDRIVGFYTFDDAVADSFESQPGAPIDPIAAAAVGHYAQSGAAGFRIGAFSVLTSFDPSRPGIYVLNDQFGLDAYSINTQAFSLSLQDPTATALSSDDLPASVPQVSSFLNTQFYFGIGEIIGVLDTLVIGPPNVSEVPLPGTLSLAALGLAALALPRRRRVV